MVIHQAELEQFAETTKRAVEGAFRVMSQLFADERIEVLDGHEVATSWALRFVTDQSPG